MIDKGSLWVQLLTSIAMLAGLGLVVWELRQTKDLVGYQLLSGSYDSFIQQQWTILGDNPGPSLFRVMTDAKDTTPYDYHVADLAYEAYVLQIHRLIQQRDAGLLPGANFDGAVATRAYFFRCPYGRAWLDSLVESWSESPKQFEAFSMLRNFANDDIGKGDVLSFQEQLQNTLQNDSPGLSSEK